MIEAQGELPSFRLLQRQPVQRSWTQHDQLHRFLGTRSGRKSSLRRGHWSRRSTSTAVPRPLRAARSAGCEPLEHGRAGHVRRLPEPAQGVGALEHQLRVVLPGDRDAAVQLDGLRRDVVEGVGAVGPRDRRAPGAGPRRASSVGLLRRTPPRRPSRPRTRTGTPRPARACRPSGA